MLRDDIREREKDFEVEMYLSSLPRNAGEVAFPLHSQAV